LLPPSPPVVLCFACSVLIVDLSNYPS
jgi:hypothetical protein